MAEAMLRGKFKGINHCLCQKKKEKLKRHQISDLMTHLKDPKQAKQGNNNEKINKTEIKIH